MLFWINYAATSDSFNSQASWRSQYSKTKEGPDNFCPNRLFIIRTVVVMKGRTLARDTAGKDAVKAPMFCLFISATGKESNKNLKHWYPERESKAKRDSANRNVNEWTDRILLEEISSSNKISTLKGLYMALYDPAPLFHSGQETQQWIEESNVGQLCMINNANIILQMNQQLVSYLSFFLNTGGRSLCENTRTGVCIRMISYTPQL